jgi:hypothetical protein
MKRTLQAAFLAIVCLLMLSPTMASAQQTRCPEGRAANGACIVPALAAAVRQIGVIFSQPKISKTAYAVLPSGDRRYRYPNSLNDSPVRPTPCCGPPIP